MWVNNSKRIFFFVTLKKICISSSLTILQPQTGFLVFLKHTNLIPFSGPLHLLFPQPEILCHQSFTWLDCNSSVISSERYFLTTSPFDLLWFDHYQIVSFSSFVHFCMICLCHTTPTNCRLHDSRNHVLSASVSPE